MQRAVLTPRGVVVHCDTALIVQSFCLLRDFDILIADKRDMVSQLQSQLAHEEQLVCSDARYSWSIALPRQFWHMTLHAVLAM